MKTRMIEVIAGSFALLLSAGLLAAPLYADAQSAGSQWVDLDGATAIYGGSVPMVNATFVSNSTSTINATAFATIHNSLGQTVAIETSPIVGLQPGQNATLSFPVGLPFDSYFVEIFIVSSTGYAISAETNCTVVG